MKNEKYESAINIALRSLENQGIPLSPPIVGPRGMTFDVMGYMLTESQIVGLRRENSLDAQGIREFAKGFK